MAAARFSSSTVNSAGDAEDSRSSYCTILASSGTSPLPSSMTTTWRTVVSWSMTGHSMPSKDRSAKMTSSSAWLTMYVSWSAKSRMFSVWRTRPEQGTAKYSSRWWAVFHPKVPTRPSSDTPRSSRTPPSRRVRSPQAP